MLQVFVIRNECKHLLFADQINDISDLESTLKELKGIPCPTCKQRADNISVLVDEDDLKQFLEKR